MKIITPGEPQERKIPAAPRTDFDYRQHYYELICGHLTDLDRDAAYRDQSSPRKKLFCEDCGKWQFPRRKPRYKAPPTEPLF